MVTNESTDSDFNARLSSATEGEEDEGDEKENNMSDGVKNVKQNYMQVSVVEGKIVRTDKKDRHVEYKIQIKYPKVSASWSVFRRYARFELLHSELNSLTDTKLPKLPAKSTFRSFKRSYIENQRRKLHEYLHQLSCNDSINKSAPWCKFLVESFDNLFENVTLRPKKVDFSEDAWKRKYLKLKREQERTDLNLRERMKAIKQQEIKNQQYLESTKQRHTMELEKINEEWKKKDDQVKFELRDLKLKYDISYQKAKELERKNEKLQQQKKILITEIKRQRSDMGITTEKTTSSPSAGRLGGSGGH